MKMNADMTKEEKQIIINSFKAELKNLLEKYDAAIEWGCGVCSDVHGIYDEQMSVSFSVGRGQRSYGYDLESLLNYGGSVTACELKF